MEAQTAARRPSGSGSSSTAYPRWVILERLCKIDASPCRMAVAKKTLAAARTSHGHPIQVSLSLQEPLATSAVRVKLPRRVSPKYCTTVAAHGGSLLIEVMHADNSTLDYFVYDAGDAAAADPPRPPSLLLLPPYYPPEEETEDSRYPRLRSRPVNRELRHDCTGILCHRRRRQGEDDSEVVVAELQTVAVCKDDTARTEVAAELFLFSSGEWSVKRPRIWSGDDDELGEQLPSQWNTSSVFAVGDTKLCWADVGNGGGVLLCDVMEESPSPRLHYVPLPTDLPSPWLDRKVYAMAAGAGAGGGTLIRLVNIYPRCCCGGAGASNCQRSQHAYTINTWTLRMDDGAPMEWVMDGMVDATELWSLDAYKGLPRVPLGFPVVTMYDEPNVICFSLCESYHVKGGGDETLWLVRVDLRSKTIRSVSRHPDWSSRRGLITSNVSYYFNTYHSSSDDGTSSMGQSHTANKHNEKKRRYDDDGMNSMLPSPCVSTRTEPAAQASSDEILAAIREIPSYGLARDDMLKAYHILSGDDGCRVTSFLRLPKNLRKDWLLMEIKADDAY